jgi:lipoprotein-anchoring transpeptidase ErfK/SrfK
MLNVTRQMEFGDYIWDDAGVPPGPVWIRVDLTNQIVSVYRGDQEIGVAVILYGTDGKPTPTGVFPIRGKAVEHRSSLYDADMPYMLRLTHDGIAIHASDIREGAATHGCIGVPLAFARLLFAQAKIGDTVAIVT